MNNIANWFLRLSRPIKAGILIAVDMMLIAVALWAAFALRLGEWYIPTGSLWVLFCIGPVLAVPVFMKLGLYRAIIRYIGGRALWAVFQAVTFYALIFTVVVFLVGSNLGLVPRTVPFINWLVLLLLVGGSRFVARWCLSANYSKLGGQVARDCCSKSVIIYGAGNAGVQLASALDCGQEFRPVAFIDDDKLLQNQKVNGLRIYPMTALAYLIEKYQITDVLLAIPSASRGRRSEIIRLLEPYPVHVRSMPGMNDVAQGKIKFDEVQEVDIADLLGRDAVAPDQSLLSANITDKVVMITGAGGSIGSELCRQIIVLQPAKVILFELNEFALYSIDKELRHAVVALAMCEFEIIPILGSVIDEVRLKRVCTAFNVQTIYHAAAYKHVPMVEHNPGEAVKNNVLGTLSLAQAAISCNVETFVLISTDKAVRPTNTMGATKRFAELVLQGLSLEDGHDTRFTMVRFGNVLGSSGSVIPLFREQIARGGPVTVTDARIIRYFMTIPEAAQLVIQAGAMGQGSDVFVLDMGEPIKIVDLAKRMIHLSGLEVKDEHHPGGEIEISFTGLRPGEKLYEELLIGDNVSDTAHCRIMRAKEDVIPWGELNKRLDHLRVAIEHDDCLAMRAILTESVAGFVPQCEVSDWLWKAEQDLK
ncbi:MAG: nucleoside-diphosphate sugar epimerase/dehydratase [Methyloprofundus sp.]|nr:nucleoside-diphosphate sugar epimerase/dehydratase [Methyloprofundus sp.]